jgi:CBS domain-containing protein
VDASLSQALNELLAVGYRHLVVVDAEGAYVGMLSDRLFVGEWARNGQDLDHCRVGELNGLFTVAVPAKATAAEAADILYDQGADAVAVIDLEGRPVGVLATIDLAALIAGRK